MSAQLTAQSKDHEVVDGDPIETIIENISVDNLFNQLSEVEAAEEVAANIPSESDSETAADSAPIDFDSLLEKTTEQQSTPEKMSTSANTDDASTLDEKGDSAVKSAEASEGEKLNVVESKNPLEDDESKDDESKKDDSSDSEKSTGAGSATEILTNATPPPKKCQIRLVKIENLLAPPAPKPSAKPKRASESNKLNKSVINISSSNESSSSDESLLKYQPKSKRQKVETPPSKARQLPQRNSRFNHRKVVDISDSDDSENESESESDHQSKTKGKSSSKPKRANKHHSISNSEESRPSTPLTNGVTNIELPENIYSARVHVKRLTKDANVLLNRFKLSKIRNERARVIASKETIRPSENESDSDDNNLLTRQLSKKSSYSSEGSDDDKLAKKKVTRKTKRKQSVSDDSEASVSSRAKENSPPPKHKRNTRTRLRKLKLNISEDSSDDAGSSLNMRKKNIPKSSAEATDSNNDSNSDGEFEEPKKKQTDSDDEFQPPKRKRVVRTPKKGSNSDDDDETYNGNVKKAKRRKRIKKVSDSSDDDNKDKSKKHRKNIRKVIRTEDLEEETKEAAKREMERKKRIAERQKLYNEIYDNDREELKELDKLVLDFDEETREELISVDKGLVKKLKPHQAQGVKFMWDACFESIDKIQENSGSGCILAHCMGLGKTLQVVTLVHTLLAHSEETNVEKVLIICPVSTVLNWVNEFRIWLRQCKHNRDIDIYEISKYKQIAERSHYIDEWHKDGGVLILGYDMFRNLSGDAKRIRKKAKDIFQRGLVDPGADLVVCDEGHLLKNSKTSISKAVNKIRTLRRIVLTGTPLQNNLNEYYCMVQFVKPNLLGKYNEYLNRFVNPITNGQYTDSTDHDIKMMKRRSHILHKLLDGCVQRKDYSVLAPFLPPKQEYVVYIRMTQLQVQLYKYYMANKPVQNEFGKTRTSVLFQDFQNLQRIWTHPRVLRYNSDRYELAAQKRKLLESDEEGSLKDFIDDEDDDNSGSDTSSSSSSNDSDVQSVHSDQPSGSKKATRTTRAMAKETGGLEEVEPYEPPKEENPTEWWMSLCPEEELDNMEHSGKLMLLFSILTECEAIGDKLLVFSQSLFSLDVIEHFLQMVDENTQNANEEAKLGGFTGSWTRGIDYFRLDGSTNIETRNANCNSFNSDDNLRARLFLISTRAGGLGINLVAANRVIIFDASWNPSHDIQSIFRVYRFGQNKPCYIYRFIALGTMEEKIYERQVTKLAISKRVVDEHQIERHYRENDLAELYNIENIDPTEDRPLPSVPKDRLFATQLQKYAENIWKYHEHDSLLENKAEETLSKEEIEAAWKEFEEEKNRPVIQQTYIGYPQTTRAPGSGPVTSNTIYGFRTDILLQLLNIKARRSYPGTQNVSQIVPMLLQHLYESMQNNDTSFYQELLHIQQTEMAAPSHMNYVMNPHGTMPTYSGRGRPPLSAQHSAHMQQQHLIQQAQNRLMMNNGTARMPAPTISSQVIEID